MAGRHPLKLTNEARKEERANGKVEHGWDIDTAERVDLKPGHKFITVDLPAGEYRVLSARSWQAGEIYPTDGRQMPNRYKTEHAKQ